MSRCCPHPDAEHQLLNTCQEVIHYPSEDYPCLCHGFRGPGVVCRECEHPETSHSVTRVCKPSTGDYCGCGHG